MLSEQEARIQEIKERVSKTTPGPWILDDHAPLCPVIWTGYEDAMGGEIAEYLHDRGYIKAGDEYPRGDNHPVENMTFMAHAREDVPWLLSEITQLREALAITVIWGRQYVRNNEHLPVGWHKAEAALETGATS